MTLLLREIPVKSILSKSNLPVCEYAANPYVGCTHGCLYCYASFMKRFTGHPEPWGTFLDVKYWSELKHPEKYAGKEIFLGSVTDPYLPEEAKYGRTRALLTQLQGSGARLSIATKSDLILRDLDLIKTFPDARVSWSINTLDETFQKAMDRAPSIERRLAADLPPGRPASATSTAYLPYFPRHHRCKSHYRTRPRPLSADLAGKPEPPGKLQNHHSPLYREAISPPPAPIPGNLPKRRQKLLGSPGPGMQGLRRKSRPGLRKK